MGGRNARGRIHLEPAAQAHALHFPQHDAGMGQELENKPYEKYDPTSKPCLSIKGS